VDSVVATFGVADGPMGTLVSHYSTPVRFAWTVTGTDGHLHGTPHTLGLVRAGSDAETLVDVRADGFESYVALVAAFAAAIRTGTPAAADGRAGFAAQAVVEAMDASARHDGAPRPVPLLAAFAHPSSAA